MANGDSFDVPKHMSYSKNKAPIVGAFIDYIETSVNYLMNKTFDRAEKLHERRNKITLSATYLAFVCLVLGFVSNVKVEVVTFDNEPIANDLHFMLLSTEDKLYIDDIDISKVLWCIEGTDCLVLLFSCLLIWNSGFASSPASQYMFLPWLGVTIRGLLMRQAPTAVALVYTVFVINERLDTLLLTEFFLLFLLEGRIWLEIARLVRIRFELRSSNSKSTEGEVETLWSNEDIQSVEVRNYIY